MLIGNGCELSGPAEQHTPFAARLGRIRSSEWVAGIILSENVYEARQLLLRSAVLHGYSPVRPIRYHTIASISSSVNVSA
jgi:hypothetical protein